MMPDLRFHVDGVEAGPCAAAPALHFNLRVENTPEDETIESILLQCQIRIEPARRSYNSREKQNLRDLFGDPAEWSHTLRAMLWTHTQIPIPAFRGTTHVELPVACTFDLTVATAKYFHGVEEGGIPFTLLFSGSVFYTGSAGSLQVAPIPWSKEASSSVPVHAWKEMMDRHYPNAAWLCLRRDVFDRLYRHKVAHGLPTWEQAIESLLP